MPEDTELETKAGLVKRTRKAFVAAGTTFAGSIGPAIVVAGADGQMSVSEVLPLAVIALTLAAGAWFAVWAVPNAT